MNLHKVILVVALFTLNLVCAGEFTIVPKLKFSEADSKLTLDLYLPESAEPVRPCVVVIQGGGFKPQNGSRFKPFAEHLAENGFAAALISYRGRPEHDCRQTMGDVCDSVRYLRSVAEKYQLDPDRIGATGRSAGGTLAALLAVDASSGAGIQAAVCFAGVFDFVARFTDKEQLKIQPGYKAKMTTNGEWIGAPFSPTNEHWLAASAINHIDAKDPPVLFLHSRNDTTVPWQQSQQMHDALRAAGVASEIKIYPDGGHPVKPKGENSLTAMTAFFQKHL